MVRIEITTLLIVLSIFMYSCASPQFSRINVSMPKDFQMSNAEVANKIPLRAGLYLSPTIKNYLRRGPLASFVIHVSFSMGDALSNGSERMLRNIFQDVVIIDQFKNDLSAENIDVVVTPEVVGIFSKGKMPSDSVVPQVILQFVVKWNIVSLDGKNIYMNSITGECLQKKSYSFTSGGIEEDEKNNMLLLIKDQFQKAQDDIYTSGWWKKQWWKKSN